jgi:long-chain acyl-CoA synthetase
VNTAEPVALSPEDTAWLQTPVHAESVRTIAARIEKPVRPSANLDLDLALDSMERVELLTLIEQQHGRRVTPETRATIFTVRQLVDAVLAAAPQAPTSAANRAEAQSAKAGDTDDHSAQVWEAMLTQPTDPMLEAELGRPAFLRSLLFYVVLRVLRPFLRVKAYGLAHIPSTGAFILSPNHQSYLDPFVLMSAVPFRILQRSFAVGAAEYYQTPFMKKVARFTNVIPVDADSNLESAMKAGAAGLRLGKVLLLFPEGERSIDGELKPFRKGASILSAHLNAPIVPVAMDGLFDLWPRSRSFQWKRILPGSGLRVPLEFGAPVAATRGKYAEGTAALRAGVERMFLGMRRSAQ